MSDDIKFEVTVKCDRTGKRERLEMATEEGLQDMRKTMQAKKETAADIHDFLNGLPKETVPDLVVMFRGKSVVLPNIVEKNDSTMYRILNDLTRKDDVFPKPPSKPRNKSKAKEGISNSTSPSSNGDS